MASEPLQCDQRVWIFALLSSAEAVVSPKYASLQNYACGKIKCALYSFPFTFSASYNVFLLYRDYEFPG